MKRLFTLVILFAAIAGLPALAAAQATDDLVEQGKQAYREGRYEEAARLLEQAVEQKPDDPEAHYLLARLYTETPLRDARRAGRALDRALELKPQELQYLVAHLQSLRTESSNFFAERIKEAKRARIARDILALDPQNAFAHEELGTLFIHDFWRYRNAISLPYLQHSLDPDEGLRREFADGQLLAVNNMTQGEDGGSESFGVMLNPGYVPPVEPSDVFLSDQFDLDVLEQVGVPVQDLSGRAQHAYDRAIDHLEQALQSDPRRRSVYDRLMEIYALKGEYAEALEMLQQMYVFFPEDPSLWAFLGLAHHRLGNPEAAAKSFETGFRYMTPEVREAYQRLDDLLPEEEQQRYRADPVAYAARFWTSKDPRYLTPYNERKLEHYARLTYADLLYGVEDLDVRGWDTQRGQILVRYGPPKADVVIVPDQTSVLGRRVLAGMFIDDPQARRRVTPAREGPLRNSAGFSNDLFGEMNTFNIWDYGAFRFVFEDPLRNGAYRLYSPSASEITAGVDAWRNDYAIQARETFREVPERYAYEPPNRRIEIPYLANAFKGADGLTDLYVHYGIPITSHEPSREMIELTATAGMFLVSEARDILVERRRTIYGLPADQILSFKETHLWLDTQQMQAPPGEHELSVEFETASGATVAVQRRAVAVPDFSQDRLALSDLLLAYHVEETGDGRPLKKSDVVRRNLSITPAPWSVFPSSRPIYLYFETYNLARDAAGQTSYDVEVALVPKEKARGVGRLFKNLFGGEEGVSLRFSGGGAAPDEGQYQILDAKDSPPGLYTLLLRVRDNIARKTVESEKDLFLE